MKMMLMFIAVKLSQLLDLKNKEASLKFQLDQVAASMSVFQNAFIEASKEVAEETLEQPTEIEEVQNDDIN